MTTEEMYFCLLTGCGFGAYRLRKLIGYFGDVKTVYGLKKEMLLTVDFVREKEADLFCQMRNREKENLQKYEKMKNLNIRFVSTEHKEYPRRLLETEDAPVGLFFKGELPKDAPSIAIIGSRDCTGYGIELAKYFGKLLSKNGVQVISGMALGIDAKAQWGALMGGGKSYAVLGCGVDICYPRENFPLYMELQNRGGILSEFVPGTFAKPAFFPMRNRIISALCDCVVVVEAREKSGTMITVDHALNQGKDVFVVPGRISDPLSLGCNQLIKQGANILTSEKDLLEYFKIKV